MKMEKEIKIISTETKETKDNKPYLRVKTSEGWMSCFDGVASENIKKNVDKYVLADVYSTDSGFKNIKSIRVKSEPVDEKQPAYKDYNSKKEMYVSYAKDVFIALFQFRDRTMDFPLKENMANAIALVKMAQEAFS